MSGAWFANRLAAATDWGRKPALRERFSRVKKLGLAQKICPRDIG